jgi:hypothetical protein
MSYEQVAAALDVSVYLARQKWTFTRALPERGAARSGMLGPWVCFSEKGAAVRLVPAFVSQGV